MPGRRFSDKMFGPARDMAKMGRFGDTLLAHINPEEAKLLKSIGGRGTINPNTGALEFATREDFDADFYLAQNPDVAAAGYGTGEGQTDPFEHYNQFVLQGDETRAGNFGEQQAKDLGAFTGVFDPTYYLEQNPDVAQALDEGALGDITTARGHFDAFGQAEKRAGNVTQKELQDLGFEGMLGGNRFGGSSEFATQRQRMLSGDTQGAGAGATTNFLNEAGTNLRDDIIGSGEGAFDLIGDTQLMLNDPLVETLQDRVTAVDTGYTGDFAPGTVDAFRSDFSDRDSDDSTPFTALNTSNISTAGLDITPLRDALREIGYEGEYGAGGVDTFVQDQLDELLLADTGDLQTNVRNIRTEKRLQEQAAKNEADMAALIAAALDERGLTSPTDSEVSTMPIVTEEGVNTDAGTDVVTIDPIDFEDSSAVAPGVTFVGPSDNEVFDPFSGTFRRTRINPFTGALEYLPIAPSPFSQAVAPGRRSGFGNLIVV